MKVIAMITLVMSVAAADTFAATRTVDLASYDEATHVATISIGAGDGTKSDVKYLFAAYDNADRGTDLASWANPTYIRTIYASTTNETHVWTLPEDWQTESGALRFFLLAPKGRRWQEGPYIASHGNNVLTNCVGGSHLVFLDTGIVPNQNTEIIRETLVYSNNYNAAFGVASKCYLFSSGQSDSVCDFFNNFFRPEKYNPSGDDGVHLIRLGRDGAFLDGVRLGGPWTKFSGSTTVPIYLFARNNPDVPAITAETVTPETSANDIKTIINNFKMGHCYIYSAQIVTNGVMARSFTPRNVNGMAVLWDSVTETAFGNSAPGSVQTLGYGTTHVTLENGTVETCSSARTFARTITGLQVGASGSVTLTLGGDTRGTVLYATRGTEDAGASSNSITWGESILLGKIPANVASYTAALPEMWWKAGGYARFVLCGSGAYDWRIESISSTGKGLYTNTGNNGPEDQGYQYIDTGVVPDKTTTTTVSIKVPNGKDMVPVGVNGGYFTFYNNSKYYWNFFGYNSSFTVDQNPNVPTSNGGKRHVLSIGPNGAVADGETYATFPNPSGSTTYTLPFFARRVNATELNKFGPCTLYYATIEQGDALVRDFIPVERNGVGYLYDRVTKKLFGNANTTYGTAGTATGPAPFDRGSPVVSLDAADVLATSENLSLLRGMQIIVR